MHMKPRLGPGWIEFVDDAAAEVLRRKTPAERIQMAAGYYRLVRGLIEGGLRTKYPEWDDARIAAEVARRIMRGTD
jgi:hypothetical protein